MSVSGFFLFFLFLSVFRYLLSLVFVLGRVWGGGLAFFVWFVILVFLCLFVFTTLLFVVFPPRSVLRAGFGVLGLVCDSCLTLFIRFCFTSFRCFPASVVCEGGLLRTSVAVYGFTDFYHASFHNFFQSFSGLGGV